jgi:hypothetical protein
MSRMIKLAKEVPVDDQDRSRMQLRQEAFGQWEKLFAYCESPRHIISWTDVIHRQTCSICTHSGIRRG